MITVWVWRVSTVVVIVAIAAIENRHGLGLPPVTQPEENFKGKPHRCGGK